MHRYWYKIISDLIICMPQIVLLMLRGDGNKWVVMF